MSADFLIIQKSAKKSLPKLPVHIHRRVLDAFRYLQVHLLSGKKLYGELAGYYKYRIGNYRIVYTFDPKESKRTILKIEHRQGVYK